MSDSLQPHRRQPTRLPCPWDSPGKNTGVGCHFLLQCRKVKVKSLRLFATPWTAAHQAPPSKGFSRQRVLEWGAIDFSGLEAQDPLYRTVPECCSSHSEYNPGLPCHLQQEKDTTKVSLDCLFKRVDRSKSSKKPELVPSTSGMNEIVACPVLPIADSPSALPSPISSTPFSSSSSLFTRCQFLFASHCTVLLYLSRYCTVSLKLLFFLLMYYLCEKYYKLITVLYS